MRDMLDVKVINAEVVTVRSVAGHGDQLEIAIRTKRSVLTLRVIPARHDRVIRVVDLRARDKRKRRGRNLVDIPMAEAERFLRR